MHRIVLLAPRRIGLEHGEPLHRLDRRRPHPTRRERGETRRRDAESRPASSSIRPIPRCSKRAIKTLWLALEAMDLMWIPVHHSWRLNERHYGALQGLNKAETAAKFGEKQVLIWRRSYDVPATGPGARRSARLARTTRAMPDIARVRAAAHRMPEGYGRAVPPVLERDHRSGRARGSQGPHRRPRQQPARPGEIPGRASATARSSS